MVLSKAKPGADELEVTLLGSGDGESCVIHLGNDRWMIVDSFNESSDAGGEPAAKVYLESLDVPIENVRLIVLTHLHRDHYRGLDVLVRHYTDARLVLPAAIEARRFRGLLSREGIKVIQTVVEAYEVARNRKRGAVTYLQTVSVLQSLAGTGPDAKVIALAPSDEACSKADESLAEVLELALNADGGEHNVADAVKYLEDQNLTSIALHVAGCGLGAILGGDVVNDEPEYGWQAIVDHEDVVHLGKSHAFKVPHHGSKGALLDEAMDLLLHERALNLVTSYTRSQIPKREQLERLLQRGDVWQTSPSPTKKSREIAGITVNFTSSGAVQARRRLADPDWTVLFREPAEQIT
jgi:beta-lactamase superfamily II metal-dependent hydrolase